MDFVMGPIKKQNKLAIPEKHFDQPSVVNNSYQ